MSASETPADRDERIAALFARAADLPQSARAEFLQAQCGGDDELRREVAELLGHDDRSDAFLETPAVLQLASDPAATKGAPPMAASDRETSPEPRVGLVGTSIGAYRILDTLGEGGMGIVYLAEQESPRRRVALKLLRGGLVTPSMLRRFEHETQVLAHLEHPGIAKIIEAGTADVGGHRCPFFAMELVDGEPLGEWARRSGADRRQRLELFLEICAAIQHAHLKGVIHRDLKPGNILVDQDGRPKVLDFGIARATDPELGVATAQTAVGQIIGTIPYMSPEQTLGVADVDTRSDVYSLGVVLFELLAGRLPIEVEPLPLTAALAAVREAEPPRLGTIVPELRGDLTIILAKALAKEPARRYQAASELASDIRRYLNDEPITARAASSFYLLGRYAKRHRALVGGVAATLIALVLGLVGTSIAYFRATDAERLAQERYDRAEEAREYALRQATKSRTMLEFLQAALFAAQPDRARDRDLTVLELLDRAAVGLDDLDDDDVAATLEYTIGRTYHSLDEIDKAAAHLERALDLHERTIGPLDETTLDVALALASCRWHQDRHADAEALYRRAVNGCAQTVGASHPRTLRALNNLGVFYARQDRVDDALPIFQRLLEARQRSLAERDARVDRTDGDGDDAADDAYVASQSWVYNFAGALFKAGRHADAEPLLRGIAADRERTLGLDNPKTLEALNALAVTSGELGRHDEAVAVYRRLLPVYEKIYASDHEKALVLRNNLASTLQRQGKLADAAKELRAVLTAFERKRGPNHRNALLVMGNLAGVLADLDEHNEAERLLRTSLERRRDAFGADDPFTLTAMSNYAGYLRSRDRLTEAKELLEECVDGMTKQLGAGHLRTLIAKSNLATAVARIGATQPDALRAAERLFDELIATARESLPEDQWDIPYFEGRRGAFLLRAGRLREAEPVLLAAYEKLRDKLGSDDENTATLRAELAELYDALKLPAKAARYRDAATDDKPKTD